MAILTAVKPKRTEDTFSTKDIAEISRIIQSTHSIYTRQLHEAQRGVNRAIHEQHRLERHLTRIEDFCKKNNISLNGEEEE